MQSLFFPISILIVIIYIYNLWKHTPKALFIGSVFILEVVWQFISIIWIDCGAYIPEQLRYSYYTGASFRYTLLILPFAFLYPLLLEKELLEEKRVTNIVIGRDRTKKLPLHKVFYFCTIIAILYLYLNVLLSGSPLLRKDITKTNFYLNYSKLPLCNVIQSYLLPFFMLFLGIDIGKKIRDGKKTIFLFILPMLILGYQLLMDNKFYGLYDYILHFITGLVVANWGLIIGDGKKRKLPLKWIIVGLFGIGVFMYLSYTKYKGLGDNPFQKLMDRLFALQSHTFWGVDLLIHNGALKKDINGLFNEILMGIVGNVSRLNRNYGIARVMYMVSPSTYANDMLKTGFLFAGSYLTVMLSYIGYAGTFIYSFFIAWICAKFSALFVNYIKTKNYVIIFILFFIYRRYFEYFRVGNLAMIINLKMIAIYIVIIIIWLCSLKNKDNNMESEITEQRKN